MAASLWPKARRNSYGKRLGVDRRVRQLGNGVFDFDCVHSSAALSESRPNSQSSNPEPGVPPLARNADYFWYLPTAIAGGGMGDKGFEPLTSSV